MVLGAAVRLGLELWWLERTSAHLPAATAESRRQALYAAQARRLRLLMSRLEGLWIKLGQFLSTRADVLPAAFTREFARLQDLVPPFPGAAARATVSAAFGRPVDGPDGLFVAFEDAPLAAASLGQVHRAWATAEAVAAAPEGVAEPARPPQPAVGQPAALPAPSTQPARAARNASAQASGPRHPTLPADGGSDPPESVAVDPVTGKTPAGEPALVPVAVKVLRPGIERAVAADLSALLWIVRGADRWTRLGRRTDLFALHRELAQVTEQEMDYRVEAAHAERFRAGLRGQPGLRAPAVFPRWVSRRVMVMEYVSGLRVDRPDELRAAGVEPRRVARTLVRSYLRQVLQDGFFHADPHPGNLFVGTDGSVTFIDFGMMAEIRPEERRHLARLVSGAITRDYDALLDAMRDLGFLRPGARRPVLRKALSLALDQLAGLPLERPDSPEFTAFLDEMREFLYTEPFQLPARYAYLGRALGILLGLTTTLDPDIALLPLLRETALPLLGLVRDGAAPAGAGRSGGGALGGLVGSALGEAREALSALYRLPRRLDRLAERVEEGELHVQTDLAGLQRRVDGWVRVARALGDHVLAAALAVCAALFTVAHRAGYARAAWIGAGLLVLAGWRASRQRR